MSASDSKSQHEAELATTTTAAPAATSLEWSDNTFGTIVRENDKITTPTWFNSAGLCELRSGVEASSLTICPPAMNFGTVMVDSACLK